MLSGKNDTQVEALVYDHNYGAFKSTIEDWKDV
jgi:hypothetical protein